MKLSDWAKKQGISFRAAWNQYHNGTLPASARQLPKGTIIVDDERPDTKAVIYARASSHDQKQDLDGQIARCLTFANSKKLPIANSISEVGSGMNGKRNKLLRLLSDPDLTHIVVEHRAKKALEATQ